jgi:hypothetical protein
MSRAPSSLWGTKVPHRANASADVKDQERSALFDASHADLSQLLSSVSYSDYETAERILQRNPLLALQKSNFTDPNGRKFTNTSALEYAAWSHNMFMLKIMLNESEEIHAEALAQLHALKEHGISYTYEDFLTKQTENKTESYYNYSLLIEALKAYISTMEQLLSQLPQILAEAPEGRQEDPAPILAANPGATPFELVQRSWRKVGLAQRMVPAYVVKEYCESRFHLKPRFDRDKTPPRSPLMIFNRLDSRRDAAGKVPWFPLATEYPVLGVDFAYCSQRDVLGGAYSGESLTCFEGAKIDLDALNNLFAARTAELEHIMAALSPRSSIFSCCFGNK